jgi:demethylmenaquinone methyltransferase/2-methoxy-6-polyprenyl-1,4-benzoquinol methylase/phosphoethanolamine N-methyltransferase
MHHKATHHPHPAGGAPETAVATIRWARRYDAVTWLMSFGRIGAIRKDIVRIAAPRPGEKVLDVGCGTGTLAIMMKRYAGGDLDVTGIDAATEMIDVARRKAEKEAQDIRFEAAAIEELPFPEAHFDLVTSTLMLHHLPDDVKQAGLREVRRVLKPGGRFLIVDLATGGGGIAGHLLSVFAHKHSQSSATEVHELLREAGFEAVREVPTKRRQLMFVAASTSREAGEA